MTGQDEACKLEPVAHPIIKSADSFSVSLLAFTFLLITKVVK